MKLSGQYIYQHSREFIKVGQNPDSMQAIRLGFRSRDKLFGDCWRLGKDPYDIESESNIEFESEGFQLFNYSRNPNRVYKRSVPNILFRKKSTCIGN